MLNPKLRVTGFVGVAANAAVSAVITAAAVLAAGFAQAAVLPSAPRPPTRLATGSGGAEAGPSAPPPAVSR